MNSDLALMLTKDMLWNAALISSPIMLTALLVGLLISILQVVTQIQEMTLTFIPKMAAVIFVVFMLGHWMLNTLVEYSETVIRNIPAYF